MQVAPLTEAGRSVEAEDKGSKGETRTKWEVSMCHEPSRINLTHSLNERKGTVKERETLRAKPKLSGEVTGLAHS